MRHYSLYLMLLLIIGLSCCKLSLVPQTAVQLPSTVMLEKLVAVDISENRNQLSTMEDEVYLFAYQVRGNSVVREWQSSLWIFNANQNEQALSLIFSDLAAQDQITFFLIELDNDTLALQIQTQLIEWVQANDFPSSFNALEADNMLGHDDLLGMKSFSFQKMINQSPLVFSGLQLFDRFRYELYFKVS